MRNNNYYLLQNSLLVVDAVKSRVRSTYSVSFLWLGLTCTAAVYFS